jgi:hypothetical protein
MFEAKSPFHVIWNICVTNDLGFVPLVNTSRSVPHSWLTTGSVTRLTRQVPLVQELLTLPEHLSSPLGFSGVHVTRSLVLYVCFVDRCLSFCTFSFGHCVVCSSIYGLWLHLWYLQTRHIYFLCLLIFKTSPISCPLVQLSPTFESTYKAPPLSCPF